MSGSPRTCAASSAAKPSTYSDDGASGDASENFGDWAFIRCCSRRRDSAISRPYFSRQCRTARRCSVISNFSSFPMRSDSNTRIRGVSTQRTVLRPCGAREPGVRFQEVRKNFWVSITFPRGAVPNREVGEEVFLLRGGDQGIPGRPSEERPELRALSNSSTFHRRRIDAVFGHLASCACGRFGEEQSARRHAVPVRHRVGQARRRHPHRGALVSSAPTSAR